LYEIFRMSLSQHEENLWKISLQTNKYAKSYRLGVYIRQSAPDVFDWMTHASFRTLCVWTSYDAYMRQSAPKVLTTQLIQNNVAMLEVVNWGQIDMKSFCKIARTLIFLQLFVAKVKLLWHFKYLSVNIWSLFHIKWLFADHPKSAGAFWKNAARRQPARCNSFDHKWQVRAGV